MTAMTPAALGQPEDHPRSAAPERITSALWPGLVIVIYGAIQADGAILTAAYRGSSPVSDDRLSFPWDGATAVTTSVVWGLSQLLFVIGLVTFARSGAVTGRAGRRGAWVAAVGAAAYVVAHGVSVAFHDADLDEAGAVIALACFGLGTLLTATGMVVAGVDVNRSGVWSGWRRRAPLTLGVWMVAMLPLQFTPALPISVAIYAVAAGALGVAVMVESLLEVNTRR